MSTFDKREKSFENSYVEREKIDFKVEARACKIFGLWAAEKLGLAGQDAENYAYAVLDANLEEAGLGDVMRKVRGDFDAKGAPVSDHVMEVELEKALAEARNQITGGED